MFHLCCCACQANLSAHCARHSVPPLSMHTEVALFPFSPLSSLPPCQSPLDPGTQSQRDAAAMAVAVVIRHLAVAAVGLLPPSLQQQLQTHTPHTLPHTQMHIQPLAQTHIQPRTQAHTQPRTQAHTQPRTQAHMCSQPRRQAPQTQAGISKQPSDLVTDCDALAAPPTLLPSHCDSNGNGNCTDTSGRKNSRPQLSIAVPEEGEGREEGEDEEDGGCVVVQRHGSICNSPEDRQDESSKRMRLM